MRTTLFLSLVALAICAWTPAQGAQFMEVLEDAYEVSALLTFSCRPNRDARCM